MPAACTDHEKAHPDKSEAKGFLADPARATLAAGVRRTLTTCIQALGTLGERAVAAQDGAMVAELADVLLPFTAEPEPGSEMETCKRHADFSSSAACGFADPTGLAADASNGRARQGIRPGQSEFWAREGAAHVRPRNPVEMLNALRGATG